MLPLPEGMPAITDDELHDIVALCIELRPDDKLKTVTREALTREEASVEELEELRKKLGLGADDELMLISMGIRAYRVPFMRGALADLSVLLLLSELIGNGCGNPYCPNCGIGSIVEDLTEYFGCGNPDCPDCGKGKEPKPSTTSSQATH